MHESINLSRPAGALARDRPGDIGYAAFKYDAKTEAFTAFDDNPAFANTCHACHAMKTVATYPTRLEADLAKVALDGARIPSVVVGIGVGMEGGAAGVQLLVPSDRFAEALKLLAGN